MSSSCFVWGFRLICASGVNASIKCMVPCTEDHYYYYYLFTQKARMKRGRIEIAAIQLNYQVFFFFFASLTWFLQTINCQDSFVLYGVPIWNEYCFLGYGQGFLLATRTHNPRAMANHIHLPLPLYTYNTGGLQDLQRMRAKMPLQEMKSGCLITSSSGAFAFLRLSTSHDRMGMMCSFFSLSSSLRMNVSNPALKSHPTDGRLYSF